MPRDLHALPRLSDRWSHLYLEHGRLEKEHEALVFLDAKGGSSRLPLDQFATILLGPGTTLTHAAARMLADNNTLLLWSGEEGVRFYSYGTGGTHSASRLLTQAAAWAAPDRRLAVIRRMYAKRFPEIIPAGTTLESIRAMEGNRVRNLYRSEAARTGVTWTGRNYDQASWHRADPINRALSAANSCLYGICHAAILTGGYSPAIGFIHTGKQLSFVYDVADLYKAAITVPMAFDIVATGQHEELERRVRMRCRDEFYRQRLLERVLPDIAEVLDAGDAGGEIPDELAGTAESLAGGGSIGGLPGESQLPDPGDPVENGDPPEPRRILDPDME
ncbi:MAG: type I-E CRISPR-associated endonuclease Cas1 [Planctomycetes bacterium]|nr:type I-E CRISPR-associated endonuclease Cas1 [Planctomycetota bacterium]